MICLVLSPEEKAQVEQARRTRPQIAERCHYVLLNAEGWSVPHIAQRLDRNEHTIRTWLKAYQTAGLPGLQNTPQPGRPATKGQEVTAQLEHCQEVHGRGYWSFSASTVIASFSATSGSRSSRSARSPSSVRSSGCECSQSCCTMWYSRLVM